MQEKLELQPCQPRAVKDPRSLSPSLKSGSNAKETLFARLCGFLFSFLYRSRYLPRCFLFFLLLFLHFFRYEFLYRYSVLGIIIGFIRDTHAGNIFEREKKKKKKKVEFYGHPRGIRSQITFSRTVFVRSSFPSKEVPLLVLDRSPRSRHLERKNPTANDNSPSLFTRIHALDRYLTSSQSSVRANVVHAFFSTMKYWPPFFSLLIHERGK